MTKLLRIVAMFVLAVLALSGAQRDWFEGNVVLAGVDLLFWPVGVLRFLLFLTGLIG